MQLLLTHHQPLSVSLMYVGDCLHSAGISWSQTVWLFPMVFLPTVAPALVPLVPHMSLVPTYCSWEVELIVLSVCILWYVVWMASLVTQLWYHWKVNVDNKVFVIIILTVTIVPDIPRVMIIPLYSNSNQTIIRFLSIVSQTVSLLVFYHLVPAWWYLLVVFSMQDSVNISGGDGVLSAGIVSSYRIYVNSNLKVDNLSCVEDECEYVVDVSATSCPPSSDISISVSAVNTIGESPSNPLNIGMQSIYCMWCACVQAD